jgi:hypothetical protein
LHQKAELTRAHFLRTFSFALTQKAARPVPVKRRARQQISVVQRTQTQFWDRHAMKSVQWKTYRTRFLVKAKQLDYALSFTDHLGRQHCGRKGDYLVESFEGVLSIAPRQIFEDIYVSMPQRRKETPDFARDEIAPPAIASDLQFISGRFEPLTIETINQGPIHYPLAVPTRAQHDPPSRARRKSPQPVRSAPSRIGLM